MAIKKAKVAIPSSVPVTPTVSASSTASPVSATAGAGVTMGTGVLTLGNKVPKGFRLKLQQMVAGLQAAIPDGSAVPTQQAVSLTKAAMISTLTAGLTDYAAIDAAETADRSARVQLASDLPGLKTYYTRVKESLQMFYGKTSPQLAQFGLIVAKARVKQSPEELLVANTKRKETRTMRNTMGSKQKAAIQFQGQVAIATSTSTSGAPPAASSSATADVPAAPAPASASAPQAPAPVVQIVK